MMSLSQGDVGCINHDDYVSMSPEPKSHYAVDPTCRCSTPDSKLLNDAKTNSKLSPKKQKVSLWKRGKNKITRWASNSSLDGKKGVDDDTNSIDDGSVLDQEIDYVDMKGFRDDDVFSLHQQRMTSEADTRSIGSVASETNLYNTPRSALEDHFASTQGLYNTPRPSGKHLPANMYNELQPANGVSPTHVQQQQQQQGLYNVPKMKFSTSMPLPPEPPEDVDNDYAIFNNPTVLKRHPYEEAVLKSKTQDSPSRTSSDLNVTGTDSEQFSIPSVKHSTSDEEISLLLKEREKYKSISESFPLSDLLEKLTMPQFLHVTRGFYTDNEDESLSDGDLLVAYCVKVRDSVAAENPTGTKFSIPLNSHLRFVVCPDTVTEFSQLIQSDHTFFNSVADLAEEVSLPKVVRVTQDVKGETPQESVAAGTVLLLEAIAKHEGTASLAAKGLDGFEYTLNESCAGGFSTAVMDTWMFLKEINDNFSYPVRAFIVSNDMINQGDSPGCLTNWPLALLKEESGKYLVASSDIMGNHTCNPDYILEIPLQLDVEVEIVSNPEKDHTEALKVVARSIYQQIKVKPGHLISQEALGEEDKEMQEELYGAVSEFDHLRKMRMHNKNVLNPSYESWAVKEKGDSLHKTQSDCDIVKQQAPVPRPRSGKRASVGEGSLHLVSPTQKTNPVGGLKTSSSAVSIVQLPSDYSVHLLRANRPLPPPPPKPKPKPKPSNLKSSRESSPLVDSVQPVDRHDSNSPPQFQPHLTSQGEDLYNVPSGIPSAQAASPHIHNGVHHRVNLSRGSGNVQRPQARNSVPVVNFDKRKFNTLDPKRRTSESPHFSNIVSNTSDLATNTHPQHSSYENTQPQMSNSPAVEPAVLDLRQKLVVLENRMSALYPGNMQQQQQGGPIGPAAYKELEKELARIRTRQVRLEAIVSEYDDKIQVLSAKLSEMDTAPLQDDITKDNRKQILSLNVHDVGNLLASLRLEKYKNLFAQKRIDGPVMIFLSPDSLDELRMNKLDQAQLMPVIRGLKSPRDILKEDSNC